MRLKLSNKSGYTLLFATLTAALVLGVAVFILSVARKQYILSSTAKDSMYAFYAADAGIECVAKNSDLMNFTIYPNPAASPSSDPQVPATISVVCGDNTNVSATYNTGNPNGAKYSNLPTISSSYNKNIYGASLTLGFGPSGSLNDAQKLWGCAVVTIDHYLQDDGRQYNVVNSRGYNLCKVTSNNGTNTYTPDASSPRTVERALQWTTHY